MMTTHMSYTGVELHIHCPLGFRVEHRDILISYNDIPFLSVH